MLIVRILLHRTVDPSARNIVHFAIGISAVTLEWNHEYRGTTVNDPSMCQVYGKKSISM